MRDSHIFNPSFIVITVGVDMFCKNKVNWLYRLDKDFVWESGFRIPEGIKCIDEKKGKVRLLITKEGVFTVKKGYSWNGCSPKFCFLDINFGTPDGAVHAETGRPKTYFASMIHDVLYQFRDQIDPIKRRDADSFFLDLMKDSDFLWARLYWLAVRVFGRLVWWCKNKKRGWKSGAEPLDPESGE